MYSSDIGFYNKCWLINSSTGMRFHASHISNVRDSMNKQVKVNAILNTASAQISKLILIASIFPVLIFIFKTNSQGVETDI